MKDLSFIKNLEDYAFEYIEECLENTKEYVSNKGDKVKVKDRHIPTVQYFLRIWLVKEKKQSIVRSTWYEWLSLKESNDLTDKQNEVARLKSDTIKKIDAVFSALATDIVANEGKGIFYAKNKLGMTDKREIKTDQPREMEITVVKSNKKKK